MIPPVVLSTCRPVVVCLLLQCVSIPAAGETTATTAAPSTSAPVMVFRAPTLGGTVWWIDVWSREGYRIQAHKIAGAHRLLDPANALICLGDFEQCQEALAKELGTPPGEVRINYNIAMPTLGGKQFWGDEFYGGGWKIQRNAISGRYRLLDPDTARQAWGTYEQCHSEYLRLAPKGGEAKTSDSLVILLPGIFRTPSSLNKMSERLKKEGYEVCAVAYPSTMASIPEHAAQINRLLGHLEGFDRIHMVCHSMGGLVARAALKERPDPRVKSIVTLGTPHKGALEADMLKDWFPYKVLFGPAGQELITGSASFVSTLGNPPCPMGCIAGGKSDGKGYSPIVPGDDDDTVEVSSALWDGAADKRVVRALHSFLMNDDRAIEATVRFLRTGKF